MFKDILIDFKAQRCGGSQVGDIVHALCYLKEVKEAISDQREKIHTVPGVIERVKELFKRHPSLLLGFNYFLPKGYEIIPNDEDKASLKKPGDIVQAVSLMYNMKKCLGNGKEYKSFLDIMGKFKKKEKDVNEVYHELIKYL
ncbi:hypothetical protein BC332_11517 [Capsicum chinense]|nr:hypothetical protein BC332_11517 [Capsicum chinense]